jgi:transcriptional regulatory protein RtcR
VDNVTSLKSGIATRNAAFNRLIEEVEHVSVHSTEPILLMGPTGAGKSQLARRIYELKKASHQIEGPFVEVNCATLRGDAAMTALFGHKKGAFTGALQDRPGLLCAADGGLLFLDEVGELGLDEQAMLLRAIEERVFMPLGADKEVGSDFKLIAGTNRDLFEHVRAGRFRDDLLARMNLWTFRLPALRDRLEDIEPNLDYELEQFARRTGRNVRFNTEARQRFLAFATSPAAAWAGNFRDLSAAVTRAATLAAGGRITVETVEAELARLNAAWATGTDARADDLESLLGPARVEDLDLFDRAQLAEVVRVCRRSESLSAAGRELFAASRRRKAAVNDADRLRKYLARFGLDWRTIKDDR